MTVHFIGAGPGAPDLITLRGWRLLQHCQTCLYAGSLVDPAVTESCPPHAHIIDSAAMTLKDIMATIQNAHQQGHDIARLHSGDPSLYGALNEQARFLQKHHIPYTITPGVPSFAAAAASLGQCFTMPRTTQTIVLTRSALGKATPMPQEESLAHYAKTRCCLVIYLSIRHLNALCAMLIPHYGNTCPSAVVYRVSYKDEKIITAPLERLPRMVKPHKITRQALIIVSPSLIIDHDKEHTIHESALYAPTYRHLFRPTTKTG